MVAITLGAADLSVYMGGAAVGYLDYSMFGLGKIGTITADPLPGYTTISLSSDSAPSSGPPSGGFAVVGDATAALAGLTAIKVGTVSYPIVDAPVFDGTFTSLTTGPWPISAGNNYLVELIFGEDPGGPTYEGPAFGAVAAGAASTGNVTPAMPAYALGDRLFLEVETANQAVTAPAGWTIVDGPQGTGTAGGTSATRLTVFTRVPTALGEAAPTIADPGDHCVAFIFNVGPCDIHAVVGNAQTSSSTAAAFGALTTTVDNCLILALVTSMTDVATARTNSWTNGFTVRGDYSSTQGNGGGVAVASKEMPTAGAVGATQCTMNTSTMQGKMLIALSPPSGTPTPSREYPRTHFWL